MAKFDVADYVDVAERIRQFKEQFPEGSLQSYRDPYVMEAGNKTFVVYSAAAYRTPDDQRPGIGWAWEPVPGPTQFTKDSELMNAETSAWGRAIVALGFDTKHVASVEEVRNRQIPDVPRIDLRRLSDWLRSEGLTVPSLAPVLGLPPSAINDATGLTNGITGWALKNNIETDPVAALIARMEEEKNGVS